MRNVIIFALLCGCLLWQQAEGLISEAAAYIDINGTDDTVRVTLMANGTSTIWSATQNNYIFSIHRLPTDHTLDPTARCAVFASNAYLVEALGPMGGSVNLPLSSLLMCSIVATDSSSGLIRGCGTIMGNMTDETTFARAVFYRPIGGTLYLLNYGGPDGVKIVGELYSVTGSDLQSGAVSMQLYNSAVGQLDSFRGDCDDIGSAIGPRTPLEIIPPANLALSKNSTLNLTNAVGYTLAVWVGENIVACSVVESVFAVGVSHLQQGTTPAIQQLLPYFTSKLIDETITSYVVLSEVGPSVNGECRNVLAVHDPWFGEGSPLGNLTSKQRGMSISAPIIGDATIVGHSLNDTQCSFLRPLSSNSRVVMGTVDFSGTGVLEGTIVMRQIINSDGTYGPTFVTVSLTRPGSMTTSPHNYHVHQRRRAADGTCLGPVGGHYNPFQVNLTNPEYMNECNGENPFRCEMGDLSGKHGGLSVGVASDADRPTFSLFDPNLHLTGPYTVLGRSIVIHDHNDGSYLTCANIDPEILSATVVETSFPMNNNDPSDVFFRINVANAMANAAGVPLGDVLVYDAQAVNMSGNACITVTMRFTGVDASAADRNAQSVQQVVMEGSPSEYSPGLCTSSTVAATIGVPTLILAMLATLLSSLL